MSKGAAEGRRSGAADERGEGGRASAAVVEAGHQRLAANRRASAAGRNAGGRSARRRLCLGALRGRGRPKVRRRGGAWWREARGGRGGAGRAPTPRCGLARASARREE